MQSGRDCVLQGCVSLGTYVRYSAVGRGSWWDPSVELLAGCGLACSLATAEVRVCIVLVEPEEPRSYAVEAINVVRQNYEFLVRESHNPLFGDTAASTYLPCECQCG